VRSEDHKLYVDGMFYSPPLDPFEKDPITEDRITEEELEIKKNLQQVLDQVPEWR